MRVFSLAGSARSVLCCLLLLPSLALAETVVVYGPGLDADAAAAQARAELGTSAFTVVGGLVALAGGAVDAPVVVGAPASECAVDGVKDLDKVLGMARNEVVEMTYESALKRLEVAAGALPCGASRATRDDLYELYFLQGFAHYNAGDDAAAVADFAVAASIDPKRPWDTRYPPTAKEAFLRGLQEAFEAPRVEVGIGLDAAFVNGEQVGPASSPQLMAGRHVVRASGKTFLVTVSSDPERAGERVLVTSARKLLTGLLGGDDAYAPWLADLARAKKWGDDVLVVGGDRPRRLAGRRFEGGETAASGVDGLALGPILLGVGAGTAAAGLSLHLVAYDSANVQASGLVTVSDADYGPLVAQNRAGFATAIIGGAVMGVGLATTVATLASGKRPTAVLWGVPTPGGAAVGFGGSF